MTRFAHALAEAIETEEPGAFERGHDTLLSFVDWLDGELQKPPRFMLWGEGYRDAGEAPSSGEESPDEHLDDEEPRLDDEELHLDERHLDDEEPRLDDEPDERGPEGAEPHDEHAEHNQGDDEPDLEGLTHREHNGCEERQGDDEQPQGERPETSPVRRRGRPRAPRTLAGSLAAAFLQAAKAARDPSRPA